MNSLKQSRFFLFTGGPGAGKSALLDELSHRGYAVVPEVARAIIKKQNATGGNATHTGDRTAYCNLMLNQSIADFKASLTLREKVFFDRGIPDLYSYSKRLCGGVTSEIAEAINRCRYNTLAFLFPPWLEIYCHDEERKQSF